MKSVIAVLTVLILLSGCASSGDHLKKVAGTPTDYLKRVIGTSTQGIEAAKSDAVTKIFDYDYRTCYEKTEALLRKMPKVSIYAKTKYMIAIYVIDPNTTAAGLFFKEIDAGHTQVEVTSGSTPTRDWVAKNVFAEKLQEQESVSVNF